jgi:WYL domain
MPKNPASASPAAPSGKASAKWSQERRLEFVDYRLQWEGQLNRSDLMGVFGISVPQASLDLARYMELAPENMRYDRSARVYLAEEGFKPVFNTGDPGRYLNDLLGLVSGLGSKDSSFIGWMPPVAAAPIPTRVIPVGGLVCLLRAIRAGQTVMADYQSMSRPTPSRRVLAPHAIAFDGFRWHARAYCFARKDFRDFVLARMLSVELGEPSSIDPALDTAWTNNVRLVLVPHPQLSESRRRVVELDYGMVGGEAVVECRQALLFYMLKHLGFNQPHGSSLTKHVVLKNADELRSLLPKSTE